MPPKFIHLPKTETFGIVLAEAMARSLPVVTVRVGGVPEVVSDGQTGIIVDSRDNSDGLIRAVEQLIADPAARQRLGEAGRARALGKFSIEALRRDLEATYGARYASFCRHNDEGVLRRRGLRYFDRLSLPTAGKSTRKTRSRLESILRSPAIGRRMAPSPTQQSSQLHENVGWRRRAARTAWSLWSGYRR